MGKVINEERKEKKSNNIGKDEMCGLEMVMGREGRKVRRPISRTGSSTLARQVAARVSHLRHALNDEQTLGAAPHIAKIQGHMMSKRLTVLCTVIIVAAL